MLLISNNGNLKKTTDTIVVEQRKLLEVLKKILVLLRNFKVLKSLAKGYFPPGGSFRAERHFLLFEDQLAEKVSKDKRKYHSARKIPCSGKRP